LHTRTIGIITGITGIIMLPGTIRTGGNVAVFGLEETLRAQHAND